MISEFINEILNITDYREQFFTEVCFKTSYYSITFKRLYIVDIILSDDVLLIKLNDGRTQELRITHDIEYEINQTSS